MARRKSPAVTPAVTTAADRYAALQPTRTAFLSRARLASKLTLPHLLPDTPNAELYKPFQSIGSRGVNTIANKLLLALFPPGTSFFRLSMDSFIIEELAAKAKANGEAVGDATAEFEVGLGKMERAVVTRMEQKGTRTTQFEALKHLVVAGNVLVEVTEGGGMRYYKLDSYVVKRDKAGTPLEIIIEETVTISALPSEVREWYHTIPNTSATSAQNAGEPTALLYTRVYMADGQWKVCQEMGGAVVPDSEGTYPKGKCAFLPLRWTKVDGEDYGRGMVEEYLGDLLSAEALSQALVEYAGIAAKTLLFVDPAGNTDVKDVAEAPNGATLEGNADKDITVLRIEKLGDMRVVKDTLDETIQRLGHAFMLTSSIQRNAERVTAEEIRIMAGELEQTLGGAYSILAQEFQRPLVARVMHIMQGESKGLPRLPEGTVEPQIVAGMEALGRSSDLNKLDTLVAGVAQLFGPEAVSEWINVGSYIKRRSAALGFDTEGFVRTDEEVNEARQAAAQREMAGKLGGPAINAAAQIATTTPEA